MTFVAIAGTSLIWLAIGNAYLKHVRAEHNSELEAVNKSWNEATRVLASRALRVVR